MILHPRNLGLLLLAATTCFLSSQAQDATLTNPAQTLHVNARSVVVDVVVTDGNRLTGRKGEPVAGLPKEDFEIFEQGKPQTITFFEEHKGTPAAPAAKPIATPNVFSNMQEVGAADAVNVILFDTLNTTLDDQSYVRTQVINYVKGMQPGKPIALFSLSAGGLRFLLGFTTDPAELLKALTGKRGGLAFSPLLRTGADEAANAEAQAMASQAAALSPSLQGYMDAMMQFQANQKAFEDDVRAYTSLDALRQIARYLTGVPGRKNVIWFSSAFPLTTLGDPSVKLDEDAGREQHEEEVERTANLLSEAQVAIYPVAAEGVEHLGSGSASDIADHSITNAQQASAAQSHALTAASIFRNRNHATMDVLASETGGEAFYNGNGFREVLGRVLDNGTHYYRIAYTPTGWDSHKGFRRIQVKLAKGHYQLAYRRGYLIEEHKRQEAALEKGDPLKPLMQPGMPDFTQIVYKMRVQRSAAVPTPPYIGKNTPQLKPPLQRYTADIAVSTKDIEFDQTPDGVQHGDVVVELIAYDLHGLPVNWLARHYDMALTPERYAMFQKVGVQMHLEIDLPGNEGYLRTGIYDLKSQEAGTLEIPLLAVSTPAVASK
jgi:VWFA-related protein